MLRVRYGVIRSTCISQ